MTHLNVNSISALAFTFGAPGLALAGLLLAAVPIIIHLLNRRRYKIHQWAAMQYLLEAIRRNRRRLRFESWLLLILRCLAVLLAAFALARPMGCARASAGHLVGQSTRLHVIIVDNSASMAYQLDQPNGRTCLARAKYLAGEMLTSMSQAHDAVAIIPSAAGLATQLSPTYDLESARQQLSQVDQTYLLPDLPASLRQAVTLASENRDFTLRRLYILTNCARPTWESTRIAQALKELGPQIAGSFEVTVIDVGDKQAANSAVRDVRLFGRVVLTSMPADFAAEAFSNSPATASLKWQSGSKVLGSSSALQLNAEGTEQVLPQVAFASEGLTAVSASLEPADRLPEDDQRSLVVNVRKRLDILVVEGERGAQSLESPATFLQLALAPEQSEETGQDAKVEVVAEGELGARPLAGRDAVILAAPSAITPSDSTQLRHFVEDGGTLVVFAGEGMNLDRLNQVLLPESLLPGRLSTLVSVSEGQEPFRFDFRPDAALHPLLRAFRGERNSGLATARVFTFARVDLDAKIGASRVLDFIGHDPAITIHSLGQGRVLFFATSADTRWTTLPAKPAFVAILHELMLGAVNADVAWANLPAGARLELPRRIAQSARPTLSRPNGQQIPMEPSEQPGSAYRSQSLDVPGLYRLQLDQRSIPIAVSFPAEASDLTHLDVAALRKALGDIPLESEENRAPSLEGTGQERSDFGWPMLLAALGILLAESFLAMWFRR